MPPDQQRSQQGTMSPGQGGKTALETVITSAAPGEEPQAGIHQKSKGKKLLMPTHSTHEFDFSLPLTFSSS